MPISVIVPAEVGGIPVHTAAPLPSVFNCNGDEVLATQDECANQKLAEIAVLLSSLGANTDQLEQLQTANTQAVIAVGEFVDQVESLLSILGGNTVNLEALLTQLGLNTDQVESGQLDIKEAIELGNAAVLLKLDELLAILQTTTPPLVVDCQRFSGDVTFKAGYKALYITCISADCTIQGYSQQSKFSLNLERSDQGYATPVTVTGTDFTFTEVR